MEKRPDIRLEELSKDESVNQVAMHLTAIQPNDKQEVQLWSKPFTASGSKEGVKPAF
ncbi:MAG: hypothetical protein WBF93_19315 [Pirellulales bacterium]